jgi:hypothetical protein
LQLTDYDSAVSLVLPDVNTRKGKTLAFNATTGAVEAGPSISDVQTVSAASADIATLADIEDGTDATDAIQTVAGIAANVTTVAGVAANVTTVAGQTTNMQNVTDNLSAIQNAASNATAAENAKTAAQAAQAAAELALDNFTDTYLGAFASDPTVDNDGNPLTTGDLYFNTTSNELKVYNGSAWQTAAVSTAGLLTSANNLSDVASASTAIANLGISATAAELNVLDGITASTAELNYTDGVTSAIQTQLDAKLALAGGTLTGAAIGSTQTASVTGSTTLDFSTYQNFVLTMTGNVTLDNPTTETVGQSGFIIFSQTAGYTVSLGTDYETAGGAGITLSASGDDIVPYVVMASGRILLGAPQLAFA